MDGVIADYDVGIASNYDKKRPLYSNLSKLEQISKMPNVELHILSVTRMSNGIGQKNQWLDEFAPFFKKENRNILSRDDTQIIFIDDDPAILRKIKENFTDILLLKDTTLVD